MLTFDLTGRSWEREQEHPYFQNLVYFGSRDVARCYWEAELPLPGDDKVRIGVIMCGTESGPSIEEEKFCRELLADLDKTFERCRSGFANEFPKWSKAPMPTDWRIAFRLDGFQVPLNGDDTNGWELCYFVAPAGRYFTAVFEQGEVKHVEIDG